MFLTTNKLRLKVKSDNLKENLEALDDVYIKFKTFNFETTILPIFRNRKTSLPPIVLNFDKDLYSGFSSTVLNV